MAEIHVQPKKQNANTSWIWIALVLIIAAALAYFLTRDDSEAEENNQVSPAAPASQLDATTTYSLVA